MNKKFIRKMSKYYNENKDNGEMEMINLGDFKPDPIWKKQEEDITKRLKTGRNETCYCGSGKKYKKCCLNTTPIEHLFNMVGKENVGMFEDQLIVGVGKELSPLEGVSSPRSKDKDLDLFKVNVDLITDYNSLWELTDTGWYGDGWIKPYILVNGEWWRWDNSQFLRDKCNTFKWDKSNYDLYKNFMLKNGNKQPVVVLGKDGKIGYGEYQPFPTPTGVGGVS